LWNDQNDASTFDHGDINISEFQMFIQFQDQVESSYLLCVTDPYQKCVHVIRVDEKANTLCIVPLGLSLLQYPAGVAFDTHGWIYVSDSVLHCIFQFFYPCDELTTESKSHQKVYWPKRKDMTIKKRTKTQTPIHLPKLYGYLQFGSCGSQNGMFKCPKSIQFFEGYLYIVDLWNDRISIYSRLQQCVQHLYYRNCAQPLLRFQNGELFLEDESDPLKIRKIHPYQHSKHLASLSKHYIKVNE